MIPSTCPGEAEAQHETPRPTDGTFERCTRGSTPAVALILTLTGCTAPPTVVGEVELLANPSGRAPLTALLRFSTEQPARVTLRINDGDVANTVTPSPDFAIDHEVPVLGMKASREITLEVTLEDERGRTTTLEPLHASTPALPDGLPPIEVAIA